MSPNDLIGLRLGRGDALFLDFDGTLAELGPDPDAIVLPPSTHDALGRLARRLGGALALISGRDLRDLAARTPSDVWRAGGHGLEVAAPGAALPPAPAPPPDAALTLLRAAARIPGVRLEIKGPVAALHYRAAPLAETACRAAATASAASVEGYVAQTGKMVVEIKPEGAHKGRTLRLMAAVAPFADRRAIMIGDDATDEDAILAVQEIGGVGVKVGAGDSAARLRAPDPAAVRAWIDREAAA